VSAAPSLIMQNVCAGYGDARVLFDVSLRIEAGECVCLLGRNGVGKTTTMRCVMGLTRPSSGSIVWKGREVTGLPSHRIARLGIGFVPEDRRIFSELTVLENLDVAQRAGRNGAGWTVERIFDLFPKLRELADRSGGYLSGGEQQMLTIARTLMGNPELLLLDEPSEGLAPLVVQHLHQQIRRLKNEGLTILLAEQNVEFSLTLADRVYILQKGQVCFEGAASEIGANEAIRRDFLAV
jgi:branched-chain amino acid transport system ATP-binding protein